MNWLADLALRFVLTGICAFCALLALRVVQLLSYPTGVMITAGVIGFVIASAVMHQLNKDF